MFWNGIITLIERKAKYQKQHSLVFDREFIYRILYILWIDKSDQSNFMGQNMHGYRFFIK